jgi:hypothetical protein
MRGGVGVGVGDQWGLVARVGEVMWEEGGGGCWSRCLQA